MNTRIAILVLLCVLLLSGVVDAVWLMAAQEVSLARVAMSVLFTALAVSYAREAWDERRRRR